MIAAIRRIGVFGQAVGVDPGRETGTIGRVRQVAFLNHRRMGFIKVVAKCRQRTQNTIIDAKRVGHHHGGAKRSDRQFFASRHADQASQLKIGDGIVDAALQVRAVLDGNLIAIIIGTEKGQDTAQQHAAIKICLGAAQYGQHQGRVARREIHRTGHSWASVRV